MAGIRKIEVAKGIYWIEVSDARLFMLCGCPADSVKHMLRKGLILNTEEQGTLFETGPNAILLSDVLIQNGAVSNLAEFPVLQMLYRQGMLLPGHPGNTGAKPLLVGGKEQIAAQMQYIYRGNYGLISTEEIAAAGIDAERARDMMRLKLRFAFGRIQHSGELLDSCIVGAEPAEIREGVFIRRLSLNVFEISYGGERVTVDLNLPANEIYDAPYPLNHHEIEREYFAVVHSGEGDGWDINRPSMGSILMYQGRIYLIDAGPNIHYSLQMLGIGINEVEGIFHTHCHDDHFSGLTTLLRSDKRIRYFATPLVRISVMKKLAALLSMEERNLDTFFEYHDLDFDEWNDIDGLEVKPLFSPHPVETNILVFRALWQDGYESYAHFADIAAFSVLEGMVVDDEEEIGISREYLDSVKAQYLAPARVKKLDVGGGLIHGDAEDFSEDGSGKIILAHTAVPLTDRQREIGSGAPFGTVDVLIPGSRELLFDSATEYLATNFPTVPEHELRILLNNPLVKFNPETILMRRDEPVDHILLVITGTVDQIDARSGTRNVLSAGAIIGEAAGLLEQPVAETYRATSFVRALKIPRLLYASFVKRNQLYDEIIELHDTHRFLERSWLFGESISYPTQTRIAEALGLHVFPAGAEIVCNAQTLNVVASGRVERRLKEDVLDVLEEGDFFGEETTIFDIPSIFRFRALEEVRIYRAPRDLLLDMPIVQWKLLETYDRRMEAVRVSERLSGSIFSWQNEYSVNIQAMDTHHKRLFNMAYRVENAVEAGDSKEVVQEALDFLIRYADFHFTEEEHLMRQYGYPDFALHCREHRDLTVKAVEFQRELDSAGEKMQREFTEFLKEWVVNHILMEDRKYGPYLNQRGVF